MSIQFERQIDLAANQISGMWEQAKHTAASLSLVEERQRVNVIIFGCGDSHHAALGMNFLINRWTPLNALSVSSMAAARYSALEPPFPAASSLALGISVSGEVARTIEGIENFHSQGWRTVALTGDPDSTLAKTADGVLSTSLDVEIEGPGLLSYLNSILLGFGLGYQWMSPTNQKEMDRLISQVPGRLGSWVEAERGFWEVIPEAFAGDHPLQFLGSGPAFGSALFSAAKVMEAAGIHACAQDVEEWTHLDYFTNPPDQPIWMLSAAGRPLTRERELEAAAAMLGRSLRVSRFRQSSPGYEDDWWEAVSPLLLWAGPALYAAKLLGELDEKPFRNFTGGRDPQEGGGASRIRTSQRWNPPGDELR